MDFSLCMFVFFRGSQGEAGLRWTGADEEQVRESRSTQQNLWEESKRERRPHAHRHREDAENGGSGKDRKFSFLPFVSNFWNGDPYFRFLLFPDDKPYKDKGRERRLRVSFYKWQSQQGHFKNLETNLFFTSFKPRLGYELSCTFLFSKPQNAQLGIKVAHMAKVWFCFKKKNKLKSCLSSILEPAQMH